MKDAERELEGAAKKLRGFPVSAMLPRVYIMTSLMIPRGKSAPKDGAKKRVKRRAGRPEREEEE